MRRGWIVLSGAVFSLTPSCRCAGTLRAPSSSVTASTSALVLEVVSGQNQQSTPSSALSDPFVVRVVDQAGTAVSGQSISWTTGNTNTESLSASTTLTDAEGKASVTLTLGNSDGTYTATATLDGSSEAVTFTADASTIIYSFPDNASSSGWINMTGNVLLLHAEEAAGTITFSDSSGNNNNGACVTVCPTAGATGRIGSGISFGGTNTPISFGSHASLKVEGGGFSISFWMKANALANDTVLMSSSPSDGQGFFLALNRWGNPSIDLAKSGAVDQDLAHTFNTGTWYHVAMVQSHSAGHPTAIEYFVNGASIGSFPDVTDYFPSTGSNQILGYASNPVTGSDFNGVLDEIAIWNRELTAAEIQTIYQNQ